MSTMILAGLLLLVPISLALAYWLHASPLWIFLSAGLAIILLAEWIRRATDQLANRAGPSIGGLLNVTFGSVAELTLALFVLAGGHPDIVKAQITGSIISTSLLGLGMAIIVGGWKHEKQTFLRERASLLGSLLTTSVIALLIPVLFSYTEGENLPDSSLLRYDGSHRVWSLWDILNTFDAGTLAVILHCLSCQHSQLSAIEGMGKGSEQLPSEIYNVALENVQAALSCCASSELMTCANKIKRSLSSMRQNVMNVSSLSTEIRNIIEEVTAELVRHVFLRVAPDRSKLIDQDNLFGEQVARAFTSASDDIREAGNCLAAECSTGSVFHLMRAAEIALRSLARDRGVTYPSSSIDEQQCGTLITSLDAKLIDLRSANKNLWPDESVKNGQIKFYHDATIEFRSFNEAWRKHVCHAGKDAFYDRDQAYSIFNHVKRFMQILAAKISESTSTPKYWSQL